MSSILEVAEAICYRIGLQKPVTVVGASSGLPAQYLQLTYQAAADLIAFHTWRALKLPHEFTTVAGETQFSLTTALPGYRSIDADTVINLTQRLPMRVANARMHTAARLNPSPMPNGLYRLLGNNFVLPGNTVAGEQILFEYDSKAWLADKDTGERTAFAKNNTDVVLLDEEALTRGVVWLFKKAKGLEYGEDFNDWLRYAKQLREVDVPHGDISLNTPAAAGGFSLGNIQIDAG
jgi:hypothetical protein